MHKFTLFLASILILALIVTTFVLTPERTEAASVPSFWVHSTGPFSIAFNANITSRPDGNAYLEIEMCESANCHWFFITGGDHSDSSTVRYDVVDLEPSTAYRFRARSSDSSGFSGYRTISSRTRATIGTVGIPTTTGNTASIPYTFPNSSSYRNINIFIRYRRGSTTSGSFQTTTNAEAPPTGTFSLGGLRPNTSYSFEVSRNTDFHGDIQHHKPGQL